MERRITDLTGDTVDSGFALRAPRNDGDFVAFFPHCAGEASSSRPQCDISTGTVIDASISRVTPPSTNSRRREWP